MKMYAVNTQIICAIFVTSITLIKNEPIITSKSSIEDIDCDSTEIHCDTGVRLHKIRYIWNIDNLIYHRPDGGHDNSIISPSFSAATNNKVEWYLEVLPGNTSTGEISLQIGLSPDSKTRRVRAKLTAAFLDDEQQVLSSYGDDTVYAFDNPGEYWGWDEIPIDAVILPDDRLKVMCNITFCEYIYNVSYRSKNHTLLRPYMASPSECNLCQDFDWLLKNPEFSDVLLSTKNKQYPAHKAILAARSPVFATMFKGNQEKGHEIKRVNITDADDKIVDEMLRYVYTGKCEDVSELADDLLNVADKYGLRGLETKCVEALCKNLTVENAANMLILADKHRVNKLKPRIIRFIAGKYALVSNTSVWKNIVKTNPEYIHEVCQVLLKDRQTSDEK